MKTGSADGSDKEDAIDLQFKSLRNAMDDDAHLAASKNLIRSSFIMI